MWSEWGVLVVPDSPANGMRPAGSVNKSHVELWRAKRGWPEGAGKAGRQLVCPTRLEVAIIARRCENIIFMDVCASPT